MIGLLQLVAKEGSNMNKQTVSLASALLGAMCISSVCLAQSAPSLAPPENQTPLPAGTFRITPSQKVGSFLIEVNEAPLESLLQAIAQKAQRKIVMSDEVAVKLKDKWRTTDYFRPNRDGSKSHPPLETTADEAFAFFAGGSFSWGKVGQDVYLLVPREMSPLEKAYKDKAFLIDPSGKVTVFPPGKSEPKQQVPQEKAPPQKPARGGIILLSPEKK
jgi:hypothetical protein